VLEKVPRENCLKICKVQQDVWELVGKTFSLEIDGIKLTKHEEIKILVFGTKSSPTKTLNKKM